jgi:hypothetical protein
MGFLDAEWLGPYAFDQCDTVSTSLWAQKLKVSGELMYCINEKDNCTAIGRQSIAKFNRLLCLDSTHKTNRYDFNLFTLVAQNKFGQGIPVAFLISRNGKSETIKRFLESLNPLD